MKIQIDTDNYTIKIEDFSVKLETLFNVLENLLPNHEWKKYTLIHDNIIYYQQPYYIESPLIVKPYYDYYTHNINSINNQNTQNSGYYQNIFTFSVDGVDGVYDNNTEQIKIK